MLLLSIISAWPAEHASGIDDDDDEDDDDDYDDDDYIHDDDNDDEYDDLAIQESMRY